MTPLLIKDLLSECYERIENPPPTISRETNFPDLNNKILVAIGMRRVGKTQFLLQHIQNLLKQNIPLSQILFINFEDDRLVPLTGKELGQLLDDFYTVYPENHDKVCYLFLDEIQSVDNWALVIRRFFDTKKVRLYLSGSSAKLLSKEIATSLRGRSFAIEIWPFSFMEYLISQKFAMPKLMSKKTSDQCLALLEQYLHTGGFPEVVTMEASYRQQILQDYVDVVVFRDIIERYQITNIVLIKYMIKTLLKNNASLCSIHKLFNDLKSQGLSTSKATLYQYLSYIEDAYLLFMIPLYSESLRKTQSNPRKIYAVDPGLANAYILSREKNLGHAFENLIYLDLRRHGHEIYYYLTQERYEVDFFTRDKLGNQYLFQVAWDVTDKETLARETRALEVASNELKINGKLITPKNYFTWLQSLAAIAAPTTHGQARDNP